jgi:hypothetical protein
MKIAIEVSILYTQSSYHQLRGVIRGINSTFQVGAFNKKDFGE